MLTTEIQRSQFVALLRNENPTTGQRLTARMNTSRQEDGETVSNRQVGYGLVFGVPKSLSIYLAITGDEVVEFRGLVADKAISRNIFTRCSHTD